MSKEKTTKLSIPLFSLMGCVFVILKLAGVTDIAQWSWLWVLAPFWLPVVFAIGILGIIVVFVFVAEMLSRK